MSIRIDTADAGYPPEACALLDSLDDSTFISLGVLFGTDLCALGATKHPSCWEPLKNAWNHLDENERDRLTHSSAQALRDRSLITEPSPCRGVQALIVPPRYRAGAKLRILLSARESPAFVIATHHESRTPAVTYFQPPGTSAIVQEIPERADGTDPVSSRSPLDLMFSYRLSTQAFAAAELARWALKPVPAPRYQPKPPRLICFFGRTEGGRPVSYQLTLHRNGRKAHIDAPDISADFGSRQLTTFMTDVIAKWTDTHRSLVPRPSTADQGMILVWI